MAPTVETFFMPAPATAARTRFCIHHAPAGMPPRALVLYVHPFAEEMNKARRMAALQARSLAKAGLAVLQLDLLGCGDSEGAFEDATWQAWIDDVMAGCRWLIDRHAADVAPTLWLWGLRAGCLLAAAAAQRLELPCNFLFWQPAPSGRPLLHQFLRLKTAAGLVGGRNRTTTDALRSQLAAGACIEVAGYRLASALAQGLEAARLTPPPTKCGRLVWVELNPRDDAQLLPASVPAAAAWAAAGYMVQTQVICGPAFWQTVEIEEAPLLIGRSTTALRGNEAEAGEGARWAGAAQSA